MTQIITEFISLTRESVSAHDLEMLHSLPPGLALHILDYAETATESENESDYTDYDESDVESVELFLHTEGWEEAGHPYNNDWEYATEVRIHMASQRGGSWAYILSFEPGQQKDPKVWVEDHNRNREFQRHQTLIVCSEIDVWDNEYLLLVDREYDLTQYLSDEYEGWEFNPYFNIYEDMTWI